MQKLGKSFFPTLANVAKTSLPDASAGQFVVRTGRLANGQAVQIATFRPLAPSRSFASSSQASSPSSTPVHGQALAHTVRSRRAASMSTSAYPQDAKGQPPPAMPPRVRESKGDPATQRPGLDDDPMLEALDAQLEEHLVQIELLKSLQFEDFDISHLEDLSAQIDLDDVLPPRSLFERLAPGLGPGTATEVSRDQAAIDSGLEVPPTIDMGSLSWQQALLKTLPKGAQIKCVFDAAEVNRAAASSGEHPQWKPNTMVVQITLPKFTTLWQAVSDKGGDSSQHANLLRGKKYFGQWFLMSRPGSARDARNFAAILYKFKDVISHAAALYNQREVVALVGVARGMGGFKGGAVQLFCPEREAFQLATTLSLVREDSAEESSDE